MTAAPVFDKGLANTIAAETQCSFIDGAKGILEYVGYDIDALARNASFEEVVFLLWNRRLPTRAELSSLEVELRAEYDLPPAMWDMVRAVPPNVLEKIVARIPVGRLGKASEIARGVLFLVSDDGGFVTGSTMSINGGQHMY